MSNPNPIPALAPRVWPLEEPLQLELPMELSVVMPCLNEADTVGICVAKALRALREGNTARDGCSCFPARWCSCWV
ncbi:MAG: hypothetical protein ABSH22_04145 [Tepidisphaeraceae bacterium]|jgi:hypothetical protein